MDLTKIIFETIIPIASFGFFVTAITFYIKYRDILLQNKEQREDQKKIIQIVSDISDKVLKTFDTMSLNVSNDFKEIKSTLHKHQLEISNCREEIHLLKKHILSDRNYK